MTPYVQMFGGSGKENLPFKQNKTEWTRLGEGQPSAMTGWVWGEEDSETDPSIVIFTHNVLKMSFI